MRNETQNDTGNFHFSFFGKKLRTQLFEMVDPDSTSFEIESFFFRQIISETSNLKSFKMSTILS